MRKNYINDKIVLNKIWGDSYMKNDLTNEEIEVIRRYKAFYEKAINMLLTSDAEADIALLSVQENEEETYSYSKTNVIKYIETIRKMYSIILKSYYEETLENWNFSKLSNLEELNKIRNEMYIDKFIIATENSNLIPEEEINKVNMPIIINFIGDKDIPYINLKGLEEIPTKSKEILISPFTKVKNISEQGEKELTNGKILKYYNIYLEKQSLVKMNNEEKNGLYTYIITNADLIEEKLKNCIKAEKDNYQNYENIRKQEQLLNKYESELEKKESLGLPAEEKREDIASIERINKDLDILKDKASNIFKERKETSDFITNWKKSVAVYLMSECKELEEEICAKYAVEKEIKQEKEQIKEEILQEEIKAKEEEETELILDDIERNTKNECKENIIAVEKLIDEIKSLILKQQNHAKIAGNLGTVYSALNNSFEMKKCAENLKELLIKIKEKTEDICKNTNRIILDEKLLEISKINIQINTLINYLKNPKSSIGQTKINRFDEMAIVEENELKRGIAQEILNIRGEAELKKLKDDIEIIEEKSAIKRIIGMLTGRNKIDEYMLEQIEVRQNAIRKTLAKKLELSKSYSIHELVAEIEMFREDNEEDELVEQDVEKLVALEDALRRNFIISDSKVAEIIEKKEAKNLPIDLKKVNKQELIEIETYRFLNKYGYDISEEITEPKYQDTMSSEINRIIEYIESSKILD